MNNEPLHTKPRRLGARARSARAVAMVVAVAVLLLSGPVHARDYYISAAGSDSQAGTQSAPWRTIARVNATALQPGDQVLFRRGDRWAETLLPPTSGAADRPITFADFGSGALPVISGSPNNDCIRWSGTRSYLVFRNLHLQGCGQPSGTRRGGINVWNESAASRDILIEGMLLEGARTWNIYMTGIDGLRIRGNIIRDAQLEHGIYLDGTIGINDVVIEENDIHGNRDMCVQFNSNGENRLTNLVLRYNRLHDCGYGGLNNIGADGLIAHHNLFYGAMPAIYNGCDGADSGCSRGSINGVYANNTIVTSGADWATCFGNGSSLGTPSFRAFVNNICVHDAAGGPAIDQAEALTGINVDYNLFFSNRASAVTFVWGERDYQGLQSYSSATGNEAHGLYADPRFVDEDGADFSLAPNSPAIDSGASLGFTRDLTGQSVPTGSGPDRGAFEAGASDGGQSTQPPATPGGLQIEFE